MSYTEMTNVTAMNNYLIENILQEPAVAYAASGSRLDLIALTRQGIKKQALLNLANLLSLSMKEIAALLPVTERTLQRRKAESRLSPSVSEQVILILELISQGVDVFGSVPSLIKWLNEENTALGGHKPLALLDTAIGVQLVGEELNKLKYGIYA